MSTFNDMITRDPVPRGGRPSSEVPACHPRLYSITSKAARPWMTFPASPVKPQCMLLNLRRPN